MSEESTPLLDQYWRIKIKHKDSILFFRLGDFYEMFGDDAIEGSKILGLALTARFKNTPNEIPMCGIPHHSADSYIADLIRSGKKIAICEQITKAGTGKIVERDVIRIITPGTTVEEKIIEKNVNNYCAAIIYSNQEWGLAFCDITTGDFFVTTVPNEYTLFTLLNRLQPAELLAHTSIVDAPSAYLAKFPLTYTPTLAYPAHETLTKHFHIQTIESFGLSNDSPAIEAAGRLLRYVQDTQKTDLAHINTIKQYHWQNTMLLDEMTIRNLELFATSRTVQRQGSLLSIIDHTHTSMGGRMMRSWLFHPLLDADEINKRLNTVEEILNQPVWMEQWPPLLKKISDIERIVGKIGTNRVNPRDLYALRETLETIPILKQTLADALSSMMRELNTNLVQDNSLLNILQSALADNPPVMIDSGGVIRTEFNPELADLRTIAHGGKEWLLQYQEQERKRSGINSLKIKFNKVFGYYIEISNSNLTHIPPDYQRKQTLVNAERFITPELKEYEEKVLTAEQKILELETNLFNQLVQNIVPFVPMLQTIAKVIAQLDTLLSFAITSQRYRYTKPIINNSTILDIKQGRHPVIEQTLTREQYIPNDTFLNDTDQQIIILTGPNMSGKSSYLRQTALIVLLAQIGCFVPAEDATIGVVDRIFTRVGASDDLSRGQSTFMVEMQEAAYILHNATNKSLVIFDELGRGTSTYDGVSIAWAVIEYFHSNSRTKILFATHYHELIALGNTHERCKNYCVLVKETETEGVVFLHQVVSGGIDRSYGIEVARLAGLPKEIIQQAKQKLQILEQGAMETALNTLPTATIATSQAPLFSTCAHQKLIQMLTLINPNTLTPLEALQILAELKKSL